MIEEINIGGVILRFFWGAIDFFKTLYSFFSYEIHLPSFVTALIQQFYPNFGNPAISVWILLSGAGVVVALCIGIYYIFKGPV